jgi:ATP-dependent Clp protease ATP-binding subunit ClpA
MAFERFTRDARATVKAAHAEARLAGHHTIEAEHLLLALATRSEFRALGLDHDRLTQALAEEEERSLASVGLDFAALESGPAPRAPREPRFATSSKLALERALKAAARRGEKRLDARHVLLGVLTAKQGRVPRTLRIAELDVDELRARI